MTPLPPGFVRTPNAAAAALINEATSLLAGSIRLSRALQEDKMATHPTQRKSVGCLLGRHRYQTVGGDNEENKKDRHQECLHCGRVKELDMYRPSDGRHLGGYGPLT